MTNFSFFGGKGGGGGGMGLIHHRGNMKNKTPPRGPTSYTFICFFDREGTPLV